MHVEIVFTSIPLPAGYCVSVVVNFHLKKKKRNFWRVRDATARDQHDVNHTAGALGAERTVASV